MDLAIRNRRNEMVALFSTVLLAGCAAAPERVTIATTSTTLPTSWTFSDDRSAESRKSVADRDYRIFGDDQLDPSPAIVVQRSLSEYAKYLAGKRVSLKTFLLSYNSTVRKPSSTDLFLYGAIVPNAMANLAGDTRYHYGRIELEIDGKPFKAEGGGHAQGDINGAYTLLVQKLMERIGQELHAKGQ